MNWPRMKLGALMAGGFGSRRLARLAAAVQAWHQGADAPLRTGMADADGDALARLAADVEQMSECITQQSAALARAERQQRELLAKVSHDLRTPLASMQGYLELLLLRQGSLDPAEERNYLQTAVRQSERLARLVQDLFELTRLEAEGTRPSSEDFALAELAHDVVQKFEPEAARRAVCLSTSGGNGSAATLRVHADLRLVERVLDSLVENALRHTPAAGTVTIELGHDAERARVTVRDSGEGIAGEMIDGLFERYLSSERVGNAGPQGHGGLGLAIARRIVLLHGGEMKVQSTRGLGTQIDFDLPLAGVPVRPEQQSSKPARALERNEASPADMQAALRAAEERYTLTQRGSQDGLWEWDIAAGAVHLSPRWKGMLGLESSDLADDRTTWLARVHADDRTAVEFALQQHLDGKTPRFEHEMRLLHLDGSVRHVLSRAVALRDDNGRAYRMVGLDADVTRLRRVQTVLDAVAEGTSGAFGERFFAAMAQHFARALGVDNAFIAECVDHPPTRVRTLAFWSVDKGLVKNFEFALPGTPCDKVLNEGRQCFHPQDLSAMFPREVGYAAYLGMPIIGSDGRVLGHLALRHRQPLDDAVLVDLVYRIFLARAAAEIERLHALATLARLTPAA